MNSGRALRFLVVFATCISVGTGVAQAQAHVRQSLQELFTDVNKVISLVRGIDVMKKRNSAPKDSKEYRTSWEYWAAIHGYPGPTSPTGTVAEFQQRLADALPEDAPLFAGFFAGLQDLTPPQDPPGLADQVWATCKHSTRTTPALHFLSWHRMYLYFFERVLRDASGDPNFALPYWDYTNPTVDVGQPSNTPSRPPSLYSVAGNLDIGEGPFPNPLFERRRTGGFGDAVQLDVALTGVDATLLLNEFFAFQESLEGEIHGFIHCAVGNGCLAPYIGLVPFSANDPLFWHHHANIDRLWSCWTKRYGQDSNPVNDASWMDEEFFFVNEDGESDSMTVSELFDPNGRIDYVYDNDADCFRTPPPPVEPLVALTALPQMVADQRTVTEVAAASDLEVTQVEQEFSLARSDEAADSALFLAMRPTVVAPTKATLKLEGVDASQAPGSSVSVYLTANDSGKRAFVGVISFFALFDHLGHQGEGGRDLHYDVSAQLQELSAGGSSGDEIGVALVASTGLVGDAPAIRGETYRGSGFKIRKIALEVESGPGVVDLQ